MAPVPAAAELLALDRLRDYSAVPFDPAGTRGTVSGQVQLGMPLRPDLPPGSTDYDISVDISNFSADKVLFGQKIEAQTLRVSANNQSYEIKGDVKVAGTPAQIEYRRLKGEPKPRSSSPPRSMKPRGRGSASMSAQRSPARCRSSSRPRRHRRPRGRFKVEADLTTPRSTSCCRAGSRPPGGRRAGLHARQTERR